MILSNKLTINTKNSEYNMTEAEQPPQSPPIEEQKVLKCKFEKEWNGIKVEELPIRKLFQSVPVAKMFVGMPFYERIKEDILTNGMNFPILVVESQFWQLMDQHLIHRKFMCPLPTNFKNKDIIWTVWGGSNRLAVARELGYTHIDCVRYLNGDFKKAHADQALHRKPYMHLYRNPNLITNNKKADIKANMLRPKHHNAVRPIPPNRKNK